jgi:uncharacterized Zn finger protein
MTAAEKAQTLLAQGRVQVKFCTDTLIQAAVRGDSSIYDVRWQRTQGWSCTCACFGLKCSHLAAVRLVTMRSPRAPGART